MTHLLIWGLILGAGSFSTAIAMAESNEQSKQTATPVRCRLMCTQESRRVHVQLTFSNATDAVVFVLERNLLRKNSLESGVFQISRDGTPVPYRGITIKRGAPTDSDFYRMKAREVLTTNIELSAAYDFSKPGKYIIKYLAVNAPVGDTNLFVVMSEPVTLVIE